MANKQEFELSYPVKELMGNFWKDLKDISAEVNAINRRLDITDMYVTWLWRFSGAIGLTVAGYLVKQVLEVISK